MSAVVAVILWFGITTYVYGYWVPASSSKPPPSWQARGR